MSMLNLKLAFALCMAMAEPKMGLSQERKELACELAQELVQESLHKKLDPALVAAVITVESSWFPGSVSKAGACGLTQVVPRWTGRMTGGSRYSCDELKKPSDSVRAGVSALDYWHRRHRGITRLALCGYNAGNSCDTSSTELHAGVRYSGKVMQVRADISASVRGYMQLIDLPRRLIGFLLGMDEEDRTVRLSYLHR